MNKKIFLVGIILLVLFSSISFASYTSNYSEPTITLKRGTYGTGVKWLQDMLNHVGYTLNVDGEFGNATYNAVISFQKVKGLEVDGIVGHATREALKTYASIPVNSKYQYTTTRVNFRSGPSTSYPAYQVLEANTKVHVYYKYDANWTYVIYNNTYGYISSQYLRDNKINNANISGLPTFTRNSTSLLNIIKNCKSYYANNNFYYSIADGVRTIPADKSLSYGGKYYVDCSSFVTWVLYEYASANNNNAMKNYFSYQRNSASFANVGANGGNAYLSVVSKKGNNTVDLSLARPGDILVSAGHVEFFNSYIEYPNSNYVNLKVYNCGSNTSIKNPGITTSATLYKNDITYILRVR